MNSLEVRPEQSMSDVTVTTRLHGPILIQGPAKLCDHEGNVYDLQGKETFALCRCTHSQKKPFCDGAHKTCGFVADEKAGQ